MTTLYKHTQVGHLMIAVFLIVLILFSWVHMMAVAEPPSPDSGTNLLITGVMGLILLVLASFSTLTVTIDERTLRMQFGFGIFRKSFPLTEIVSAEPVKNSWYYGWGIRLWLWPKMWIFNVSGFDAIEIRMRNGSIYRIGTDVPHELHRALQRALGR